MFCPQCGTSNQDDATSCSKCGTFLIEVNLPDNPEPGRSQSQRLPLIMALASLASGILAFLPYPYLASRIYYPILRQKPFLHGAFDLGCLGGFPLGLLGIILGILAWKRSQKSPIIVILVIIGILLGIGGFIGHAWFILTCQFCQ